MNEKSVLAAIQLLSREGIIRHTLTSFRNQVTDLSLSLTSRRRERLRNAIAWHKIVF